MVRNYGIEETTLEERISIVNSALALARLDAREPSVETKELVKLYISGEVEIASILQKTISRYKNDL
ncbi:hypothetical protein KQI77_02920 [Clostridium sp. MSJ-8]|uniref:hypothetical protein n=1 Tax=Clostridium sp. MSJ-8 TaxID=2841510 RepID=UPI001C0EC1C1|nr:hypothetical protein [Clostridium sp. MSJ-8]MBU5487115.1 hypothetical protein [Clostridium sp. MSJ-8]